VADDPKTADDFQAAQVKEYSTYVAKAPIFIDGARAFNAGAPVPVDHITRGVVHPDQVAKVGTKAAAEVTGLDVEKG
jgi:hypothetical protein